MRFKKGRIDIITMGCSKNLIDSERLIRRLEAKGYTAVHDSETPSGEYVVVNTCGFISDAKEESIDMILRLAELKKKGKIGSLAVMGCLSERYASVLPEEIPEVDNWYGKFNWKDFVEDLPDRSSVASSPRDWERTLTTPPWSAYVKISEGCDRYCAYCAIPYITGRHKSRPKEEILEEVRALVASGVKEFNVIAQDLSSYGTDLYGSHELAPLIQDMANVEGVEWIRLHYLYPTDFPMDILPVIRNNSNVCKYIDIALQHISDPVLQNMNRKISKYETVALLDKIRSEVPGIHIRTTLMTGFPGEGEKEFSELKDFVIKEQFERLGAFAYSEEDDTLAARNFKDEIPQNIKEERLSEIMTLQEEISNAHNLRKIGKKLKVLVEEQHDGFCIGRSEFDSPEVDQDVVILNCRKSPGEFVEVEITEADTFSITGRQIED